MSDLLPQLEQKGSLAPWEGLKGTELTCLLGALRRIAEDENALSWACVVIQKRWSKEFQWGRS